MPLTRYEVRNEYSLANPDLYRAAAKDDPEGLLEGVAMAGLVGIVRQLGDLAEFAAEVFHDLHEEVLATAARGHELLIRIQQLEAELPFVEKLLVAESNYVNFAYNPGLEWHANVQNEQNHFTQGDLPRFIRNAYEDCRGPPRLFLLDKFDIAGAGACLKRYTDPSFFRMEWASSELMKAEKEQQDKKARRIKKKGRRQREIRETFFVGHIQTRNRLAPLEEDIAATSASDALIHNSCHSTEQNGSRTVSHGPEQRADVSRLSTSECDASSLKAQSLELLAEASTDLPASSRHQYQEPDKAAMSGTAEFDSGKVDFAGSSNVEVQRNALPFGPKVSVDVADFTSETDNYADALTTIDSEVDTDLDVRTTCKVDKGWMPNQTDNKDAHLTNQSFMEQSQNLHNGEHLTKNDVPIGVQKLLKKGDTLESVESAHVVGSDASVAEEKTFLFSDGDQILPRRSYSTPSSGSLSSMPVLEKPTTDLEENLESDSVDGITETPETTAASECEVHHGGTLSADSHKLPESVSPLDNGFQNMSLKHLAASTSLEGKAAIQLIRQLSGCQSDKENFEDAQWNVGEHVKESPHSSPESSIQPMKWVMEGPRHSDVSVDSDDELDGMQVSSPSSSSSNSALSSPRPSTLATTVFENKSHSALAPLMSSPESLGLLSPDSPVASVDPGAHYCRIPGHTESASQYIVSSQGAGDKFFPECLSFVPVGDLAVENQDEGLLAEDPELFPPPPPLPPLEWRTTRRVGGLLSSSTKVSDSSFKTPAPQKSPWGIRDSQDAANLPPVSGRVSQQNDSVLVTNKGFSTTQDVSEGFSMPRDVPRQIEKEEAYDSETERESIDVSEQVLIEELPATSGTVSEVVKPHLPVRQIFSVSPEVPSTDVPGASLNIEWRTTRRVGGFSMPRDVPRQIEKEEAYDSETERETIDVSEQVLIEELPATSSTVSEVVKPHLPVRQTFSVSPEVPSTDVPDASLNIEWRTTRRVGGLLSSSNKVPDSSFRISSPQKSPWRIRDSPDSANLSPVSGRVPKQNDSVLANKSFSTAQDVSEGFSMPRDVPRQIEKEEVYDSETERESIDVSEQVLIEELPATSGTVVKGVQPYLPVRKTFSLLPEVPSIEVPGASLTIEHPGPEKVTVLKMNEPTIVVESSLKKLPVDYEREQDSSGIFICKDDTPKLSSNVTSKALETRAFASATPNICNDNIVYPSQMDKQCFEKPLKELRPPLPSSTIALGRTLRPSLVPKTEGKDNLIAAIASHDKNTLRKVSEWSQSSRTVRPDDREVLLQQIRTGSFSLRRTQTQKQETPRPVASINVAAILEKANAIRQAFVGSDDDDEDDTWSDN